MFWILLGLLCIGAGKVRLHYHAYLKAASRNDSRAAKAMASELTLIHGVPPGCDERGRSLFLCAVIVAGQVVLSVFAGLGFAKDAFPGRTSGFSCCWW